MFPRSCCRCCVNTSRYVSSPAGARGHRFGSLPADSHSCARGLATAPPRQRRGRLGIGLSYAEEEFRLAQQRLKKMDPLNNIGFDVMVQLKALHNHAMEGNAGVPDMINPLKPLGDIIYAGAQMHLEGVSKDRARGEYIRMVTQLWEQNADKTHATYRRGVDDDRTVFRRREEEQHPTGSDGHIIGSGHTHSYKTLLYEEIADGVQTIWFSHPLRNNSLTFDMLTEMPRLLEKAASNPGVFATVLTGEGDCYCGGLDDSVLRRLSRTDNNGGQRAGEEWKADVVACRDAVEAFVSAFITHGKPIVAAVNGHAVGLGASVLALCDLVYAQELATFHTPNVQLGMISDGCASYTLPRIVGRAVGSDMLLRGSRQLTEDAFRNGLITYMVDENETIALLDRVLDVLATLSGRALLESRHLIRSHDRAMLLAVNKGECDTMVERWMSEEGQAAISRHLSGEPITVQETSTTELPAPKYGIPGVLLAKAEDELPKSEASEALPAGAGS